MINKTVYLISSPQAESGALETLPPTENLEILTTDDLNQSSQTFDESDILSITSESVLEVLLDRIESENQKNAILVLKDKAKFREVIAPFFPEYSYHSVPFEQLEYFRPKHKMVVKPQKGFFGTGVKIIDPNTGMRQISRELKDELATNLKVFSDSVLSAGTFIIEDFIEGEEYAADIFYDNQGTPQIANLYCHPSPKHEAYVHMLYYSSKEVFEKIQERVIDFFTKLNEVLQVKNFPVHGEFKLHGDQFVPIEMNPLRFGGVGLGNMVYHAMGINPYQCMSTNLFPNWSEIWEQKQHLESIYTYLIAYNGKNVDVNTMKPNLDKLRENFSEVINETLLDYQKGLTFGLFTLKETKSSVTKIATLDFDDFFTKI